MRKRLYETIFCHKRQGFIAAIYDGIMILAVFFSISTIFFKETDAYYVIDRITLSLFLIDYALRLVTADYKYKKRKKALAFITYPLMPMSVIDLVSILPSLTSVHSAFKFLKIFKLLKLLRIVRLVELVKDENEIIHELEEELHHKEETMNCQTKCNT